MDIYTREYELQQGFIHNWLVAGPLEAPVSGPDGADEPSHKLSVARVHYDPTAGIEGQPLDRASFTLGDSELSWRYVRCYDDHFVDLSTFRETWTYMRAWAYAQVRVPVGGETTFVLTTNGPADVWLNGEHVHRQEHFHHQQPHSVQFQAPVQAGENVLLVRFEAVAARECPYVMALQLADYASEPLAVLIPTDNERIARHMLYEKAFEQASLATDVSFRGKVVNLHWAEDMDVFCRYDYSIQDSRDRIYVSGSQEAKPGHVVDIGHGFRIWEGPFRAVLRPVAPSYYNDNIRYQRDLPVFILDTAYSDTPYGSYEERYAEALAYAAGRGNLYAEIAKIRLGRWDDLDLEVWQQAIARINARADCSDFDLVGLLGVMQRYLGDPSFPAALRAPLKACVLGFKYWHDEPGHDAMCYTTENHSILFHTCEILAGQLYPDEIFSNNGESGVWHREKGERLALAWLKTRAATGFWEWDSNTYFDEDVLALSHLVGLAQDEQVAELAAVVLDKLLFTLAVNSYKGVFGSTHGRSYAPMLKNAQLEATSGISRLLWGMGVFNPHIRGLVGLACSEYEFPQMIAEIAKFLPDWQWSRERHVIDAAGNEVNKITYKTPDYQLSSAQDFRPGELGYQEHIWQATFGPDAVVFVTHPACMSEDGAHRPNFWAGNRVLPRVAQWNDVLFALHRLPEDDWMGFTHAYFPVYTFDEYVLRDGWAFARSGEGYLALTASQGIELTRRGPAAYRELRSYGQENVWVCQMGRAALDGDFVAFQDKVLAAELRVEGLTVHFTSLRDDALAFDWTGPLLRNGEEEAITGFKHYENPFCAVDLAAQEMDIQFGGTVMRLSF